MGDVKSLPIMSDHQLITNITQNGVDKRKAEEEIFSRYSYFIREGMNKHSLTEDESFDAYSDTILQALDKIAHGIFEGRSSLKTYLFRIFHNKCVDLIRKKSSNKHSVHQTMSIPDALLSISDAGKSVIQQLIDKSDIEYLKRKLGELGESCRQLLMLFADGFTDKEITQVMQYRTSDVVKTSRLRCLDKLRQSYNTKP